MNCRAVSGSPLHSITRLDLHNSGLRKIEALNGMRQLQVRTRAWHGLCHVVFSANSYECHCHPLIPAYRTCLHT